MKRHLLKARGMNASFNRAACGLRAPPQFTTDPERVTCLACSRTVFMADAEFRLSQGAKARSNRGVTNDTDAHPDR